MALWTDTEVAALGVDDADGADDGGADDRFGVGDGEGRRLGGALVLLDDRDAEGDAAPGVAEGDPDAEGGALADAEGDGESMRGRGRAGSVVPLFAVGLADWAGLSRRISPTIAISAATTTAPAMT